MSFCKFDLSMVLDPVVPRNASTNAPLCNTLSYNKLNVQKTVKILAVKGLKEVKKLKPCLVRTTKTAKL